MLSTTTSLHNRRFNSKIHRNLQIAPHARNTHQIISTSMSDREEAEPSPHNAIERIDYLVVDQNRKNHSTHVCLQARFQHKESCHCVQYAFSACDLYDCSSSVLAAILAHSSDDLRFLLLNSILIYYSSLRNILLCWILRSSKCIYISVAYSCLLLILEILLLTSIHRTT